MYTDINFKTKKALKEAVRAHQNGEGPAVTLFNPGPFGDPQVNGEESVEGPHYPKPHTWYARVTLEDGIVTRVR
jgi:hypothetical protein